MKTLEDYYNFQPKNEEERFLFENLKALSKKTSTAVRSFAPENRLAALKEINPSDDHLLHLYVWALKQEDYETCEVTKKLIAERGIPVKTWPTT